MNPTVLFNCCKSAYMVVAFMVIPMLVLFGVVMLCVQFGEKYGAAFIYWIGVIASTSAVLFSMCLMLVLTKYIVDCFHNCFPEIPDNGDPRHGLDHAPSQDDLRHGIERSDRIRRLNRELEEERRKKVEDLFELFPSVSYTSQGVGSDLGDCAICLGNFMEGELCWVLPSCKHMFHSFCIHRWLMNGFCCPVCRDSVLPV